MKDVSAIKNNRGKFLEGFSNTMNVLWESIIQYVSTISERTLSVVPVVILYCAFLPNFLAYNNGLSDKLVSLDIYIMVMISLVIMSLRAILKNDKLLILTHLMGFIAQTTILATMILR